MKIFYRLSDGSYAKVRFENATKENCLINFLSCFNNTEDEMELYLDNVKDATFDKYNNFVRFHNQTQRSPEHWKRQAAAMSIKIIRTNEGSSAASFRTVFKSALELDNDEIVYFIEDDYAHLKGSRQAILEGLERSHYVSLYDHLDTYIPASDGGNKFVTDAGYSSFHTSVIRTKSSHWRTVSSTTMTFATTVGVLKQDKDIWDRHIVGSHPNDFLAFLEIAQRKQHTLITPIPAFATHCEPQWASPGIDWEKALESEIVE